MYLVRYLTLIAYHFHVRYDFSWQNFFIVVIEFSCFWLNHSDSDIPPPRDLHISLLKQQCLMYTIKLLVPCITRAAELGPLPPPPILDLRTRMLRTDNRLLRGLSRQPLDRISVPPALMYHVTKIPHH